MRPVSTAIPSNWDNLTSICAVGYATEGQYHPQKCSINVHWYVELSIKMLGRIERVITGDPGGPLSWCQRGLWADHHAILYSVTLHSCNPICILDDGDKHSARQISIILFCLCLQRPSRHLWTLCVMVTWTQVIALWVVWLFWSEMIYFGGTLPGFLAIPGQHHFFIPSSNI